VTLADAARRPDVVIEPGRMVEVSSRGEYLSGPRLDCFRSSFASVLRARSPYEKTTTGRDASRLAHGF